MTPEAFVAWAVALSVSTGAVAVATLVVVSCWRAIRAPLRPPEPRYAPGDTPRYGPVSPAYRQWLAQSSRGAAPLDS